MKEINEIMSLPLKNQRKNIKMIHFCGKVNANKTRGNAKREREKRQRK